MFRRGFLFRLFLENQWSHQSWKGQMTTARLLGTDYWCSEKTSPQQILHCMEIWVCRGLVSRQLHFIFGVKSNPMSPKRRLRNRGKGNLIFDMQSINQLYGWSAEGSNKWRRKASLNLKVSKQLIRRTVFSSIKTPNFLQWREIWLLFWGFVPRVPGQSEKCKGTQQRNLLVEGAWKKSKKN